MLKWISGSGFWAIMSLLTSIMLVLSIVVGKPNDLLALSLLVCLAANDIVSKLEDRT